MKRVLRVVSFAALSVVWALSANGQISSFPHYEDFETFSTCTGSCNAACALANGWSNEQGGGDSGEWTTDVGGTSSSLTGPSVDYDPGTSAGKYLYVESSSPCFGVNAFLYAPTLDLSAVSAMNMVFSNHMYGSTMGTLNIDVSVDGGLTWDLALWTQTGDQGDVWNVDTVNLSAYAGLSSVIVRFRGITGTSFYSDMAIDAVKFYEPLPNDAGVVAIPSPGLPSCNLTNSTVEGSVMNFGYDTLTSFTINWAVNLVPQTPYSWTGTLAPGQTATQAIGTYSFVDGDVLQVWTSMPNGLAETGSGPNNDTTTIFIQSGLAGVYTIGATGDYLTFTEAVADLVTYGVCDDVTFNVQDGIYNEQITIVDILGVNDTNTVTFQSLSGDPTLCVLNYNATGIADNYVINMNGGDYFTFRNLGISNEGTLYGRVIDVNNGSHYNTWEGNIISGDPNNTSTSFNKALIYSAANTLDSMNIFAGNDILYGSYGMYWYGTSTTIRENGTKIVNNVFDGAYYRPIHSYYQDNIEISGNVINPGTTYTGAIYRIYMYYNNGATRVYNNQLQGNKYGYGIYMSNCSADFTNNGYIYNNFIHVGDSAATSTSYGVYMITCNNQVFTYNSVNLDSDGINSRGLYISGGANNVVTNNAIQNTGAGYGFYYASGVTTADNNNVYVPNGNIYYYLGNINTLNAWQNATGFGLMSDTLDPVFASPDDLHTCSAGLDGAAMPDTMVMYDIDGDMRDPNTPDIGADEFLLPSALSFDSDSIWKCAQDAVTLGGWVPSTGATYQWSTFETTPTITVSNPGTYSVNILNSCGTGSPSVVVVNYPDAVADFNLIQSFMTAEVSSTATGTFDTYLWDMGDGTTYTTPSVIHVYADTGYYTITLTVTGICGSDSYSQTMYSNIVGLDELSLSTSLNVYPNPSEGAFVLSLNVEEASNVSAVITDLQGKEIWGNEFGTVSGSLKEEIRLTNYSTGMYLLKVDVNGASTTRRIMIK